MSWWPFRTRSARRREIRRARAERGLTFLQQLRERVRIVAVCVAAVAGTTAAVIVNTGGEVLTLRTGQTVSRAVTARVDFSIEDAQQTAVLRNQAREAAPSYFRLDPSVVDDVRGRLMGALNIAKTHTDEPATIREETARLRVLLDDAGLAELIRVARLEDVREYTAAVDAAVAALATQPLAAETDAAERRIAVDAVLIDAQGTQSRIVKIADLLLTNRPETATRVGEAASAAFAPPLRSSMRASIASMLAGASPSEPVRPLYRFDGARTEQAAADAANRVRPYFLKFPRDSILADAGVITAKEMERIQAEHVEYVQAVERSPGDRNAARLAEVGRGALAILVSVGLIGFVYRYRPRAADNPVRQVSTALVLLGLLAAARWTAVQNTELSPYFAVGLQAFAAGLLGIVFGRVLIFGICGAFAVLVTLASEQGSEFLVVLLAVSGAMVFGLRDVRQRGKIVAVGALAGLIGGATAAAAGLLHGQTLAFIGVQTAWAAGATLAAAFLVEGLLPWIERLFGVATAMTLLEWCDANRPLLRMLAAEAPGTYNHSLIVGALAESAAEAIGANGLLARAGSYYHDVGKINKPEYFVENQSPNTSRHERLSPAMSLLIIIGHVKDGIEMAREYGVPPALHPFIAEHHGTTLVEYFYHAANKARRPDDPEVADAAFRYPGPKPQSRETAIVMLCDGVEGAVRALSEPTPGRIEVVVSEIVAKRLMDGQFDECDLNFRELATVERRLVKSLCSIYHGRIVYPEAESETGGGSRHAS
ncbi:MAG: HD family phosphohydrolase [Phycisphaerae bacterium]